MNDSSVYAFEPWQICVAFFAGILIFAYLGLKSRIPSGKDSESASASIPFRSSVSALGTVLSLLIGFTFGMSEERFITYKKVMTDEINRISTACIKSDLYPEPYRSELRKNFSDYVEARISFYDAENDINKINESKNKSGIAGKNLWEISSRLFRDQVYDNASRLMIPSLTEMFDASNTRDVSLRSKSPFWIILMIFIITFLAVYIYTLGLTVLRRKEIIFIFSFAIVITMITFIILELDRPDSGIIKPTVEQEAMIELRKHFTEQGGLK